MPYTPQQDSFAWKVIEFFTTNPDEELTAPEVGIKFDKPSKQVHSLLAAAVESGALVRATNDEEELVYRLGTGMPAIKPAPGRAQSHRSASPWPGQQPPPPRRTAREPLQVDLQAVAIESDIPLPTGRTPALDWPALFQRMAVGTSCLLPWAARQTLSKAMTAAKKAGTGEYSLRRVNDEQLRLWRLK